MDEIPIITDTKNLTRFASDLLKEKVIAVDLEADSMHNYQEKVCLLQFSTEDLTVLVDPLSVPDLSPLQPVMADPGIRKIFHAADYDIRSLFRDFEITVRGLFDTMVSCQFLGEEKVGLNDILQKYFGVSLNKKYQRADWSRRPLSNEMIRYAAEDTRHLIKLAAILEEKLSKKNRMQWAAEEFSLLEEVRHSINRGPFFMRIKGAWKLTGRELATLEVLLQWRDREAKRRDCPLFKVIGNKDLMELPRHAPGTLQKLKSVPGFPPRLADRYGKQLIREIVTAQKIPEKNLPIYPRQARQQRDRSVESRLKKLKKWRSKKAGELGMDQGIVINNSLLEELLTHPPADMNAMKRIKAMKDWQHRELGPELLEVLQQSV